MISTRIRQLIAATEEHADIKKHFHPEPNVMNHLGQVATLAIEAEDDWDVCYAALLHDIAKNKKNNPKAWSQHAFRGAMMVANEVTPKVRWLVESHMKPYDYTSGKMKAHKRQALEEHPWFDELMRLNNYDHDGRRADGVHMPWPDIFDFFDEHDPRENEAVLMIGIQASGKSTMSRAIVDASRDHSEWWKPRWERTSRDDIRVALGIGPGQWRHQEPAAIRTQQDHIRMALGRGQGVVIDNCHNTIRRRRDMMEWLREEFPGIVVKAHLVYAPLEVCIKRNKDEHGQPHRHRLLIPDKVLAQFHGDMKNGFGHMGDDANIINRLTEEGFDNAEVTRTA